MKNNTATIIGGAGKFGQHLAHALDDKNDVRIVDPNAKVHNWPVMPLKEAVPGSDVIIISVPIRQTVPVIHNVGDHITANTLLCDVTSVKKKPFNAMQAVSDEVLGMHPMYAPSNRMSGQKVVLTPGDGEQWRTMQSFWEDHGATTHVTDPQAHDKAMSLVQGLMHFSELVVAETIRRSDMQGEDMASYSSPVYQLITDLTARTLNQQPGLYGAIQSENPENETIRETFLEAASDIQGLIQDKDAFAERFEALGEEFDLNGAQQRTDAVINFISDEQP